MVIYGPYQAPGVARVPAHRPAGNTAPGGNLTFHDVLRRETTTQQPATTVRFSKHAEERLADRGIHLDGQDLERLDAAVDKAMSKGSNQAVVLLDENAFIVSVPPRTVVTVMEMTGMRDAVVTNIDSFVWAGP